MWESESASQCSQSLHAVLGESIQLAKMNLGVVPMSGIEYPWPGTEKEGRAWTRLSRVLP